MANKEKLPPPRPPTPDQELIGVGDAGWVGVLFLCWVVTVVALTLLK